MGSPLNKGYLFYKGGYGTMLPPEQSLRLDKLRRNRIARAEYKASGEMRRCNVNLDKGELTLAQWIRRELTIRSNNAST